MGSKRRAATGALSVALAALVAIAVYGRSCEAEDQSSPVAAVRSFLQAVESGERGLVAEHLSPMDREKLKQSAARATELAGGSRRYTITDMISLAKVGGKAPTLSLAWRRGDRAAVAIERPGLERAELMLRLVEGRWLIELSAPSENAAR